VGTEGVDHCLDQLSGGIEQVHRDELGTRDPSLGGHEGVVRKNCRPPADRPTCGIAAILIVGNEFRRAAGLVFGT
jgi:hypothetical protein